MQRNRTYSRDSGRPIISAASTPASHDSRQLADATLSVAVTKPSALSFLEPPPLSLLPLAPPGESELYAFDSYASDADRFRRKVQELEEKRQAALREVDDARVKSLRSPSTLAVPASEVDPSSPAKSSFSKESDYTLESRTTDATSFFSASYRPSINSDHSAGFDKTPQTPNVPATVALPSLSQRRGTLAFLRRPSLANTWGRRKVSGTQAQSFVTPSPRIPAAALHVDVPPVLTKSTLASAQETLEVASTALALVTPPLPEALRANAIIELCLGRSDEEARDDEAIPWKAHKESSRNDTQLDKEAVLQDLFQALIAVQRPPVARVVSTNSESTVGSHHETSHHLLRSWRQPHAPESVGGKATLHPPRSPLAQQQELQPRLPPLSPGFKRLSASWWRRGSNSAHKQHESPVLVAAAVPAAPPSPLVIKPIEATVRDKKKEEMTKLLDDPDKLADAMTRSTRLRDQLVEADTILNELGWQWGAQANEIWGEGCGHRYLADATVSYAAAESTDARRESGTSSTSDVDMTDAGDMNLPSTSISNHSTDEAAEFVHRGKRYRRHSLGAKVVNKRPRSSSTVTLDSKGLLPTGAAPLLHWRGFNKAYQQGSLDMDEVHYQPRGAPEFSTCPDATPLAVGEYNPPAPEWEARRLRAYWRMQVDRISVDRIGRITSRLEICRAYLGVGEANLRFFEADGTVTTVKEDRLLRAPPSKQSGLCAHALLNRNNGLVILDTSLDWRFQTLGLVGTRFYTGMPVLASSGLPVAVVSFSCQRAWRIFKPDERAKVREVARMIGNELEAHLREIWEAKITLMTQSYADIKTCLEDSKWRSGLKLKTSRTHMGSEYGRAAEMQHNESSGSCRPKITVVGPPSPAPYVKHVPRGLGNNVSHNPIDLEALSKIGVMLSLEDTDRYRTACEHMAASLNIETVYVIAVNLLEQSISPSTVEDNTKVPFVAPLSPALLSPSRNIPTLLVPSSSMLPATSKDARKDACILLACHGLPSPCPIFESKLHSRVFSSGHDPFLVFQNDGKRGVVDPEVDKDLLLPRRCSEEKRKETFYSGIMVQVMTDLEWKRKKQKEDHDNTGAPSYEPPTAAESTTSPPAKTGFVLAALSRRPDRALAIEDLRYLQACQPMLKKAIMKAMDAAEKARDGAASRFPGLGGAALRDKGHPMNAAKGKRGSYYHKGQTAAKHFVSNSKKAYNDLAHGRADADAEDGRARSSSLSGKTAPLLPSASGESGGSKLEGMARIRQVRPSLAVHIPFASSTRTVPTKPGLQKDLHLPLGDLTTSLAGSTALGSSRLKGKGSDGDLAHSTGVQRMLMKAKVVAADVTKSSPPLRGSPASSNGSKRFPSSDSYLPHDQSKLVVTTKSSVPQTHDPHGGHSMVKGHSGQGGLPGHLRSGWSAAATYLGSAMHAKPVEVHAASPEEKIATFVAPTGRSASRARASRPQVVRSHTGSSAGLKASVSPALSKTSSSTSPTPQSSTRSSPSLDAPLPSSVSPGLRITTSPVATPLPPRDRSPVRFVMKVDGPDAMLHSPSPLGARGNVTHARDIEKIRMKVPNLDVPTAPILRSCAHERNLDFKLQKMSTPERAAAAAREAKLAKLLGTAQFESPSLLGARAKAPHKHQTSLEVAGVALSPLSAPAPFPSMTGGYRRKGSHLREVANPMDGFFQPLADRSPLPSPPPSGEGPHFEFQNATFGLQAPDIRLSPPPSPLSPRSLAPHSEGGTLVGQRSKAF